VLLPLHTVAAFGVEVTVGKGFTVAVTVPAEETHPLTVTVTEYVPLAAVVAFVIEGSSSEEVNAFGPVHE